MAAPETTIDIVRFKDQRLWHILRKPALPGFTTQTLCGDIGYADETRSVNNTGLMLINSQMITADRGAGICGDCADKARDIQNAER
jgi:hypothetical protein